MPWPFQVVGTLKSDVAEQLGLGTDVIVAPGSGDNQMSALGAGAVQEGRWVVSLGTSGRLSLAIEVPMGAGARIHALLFPDRAQHANDHQGQEAHEGG